jgi:hypothetical protein
MAQTKTRTSGNGSTRTSRSKRSSNSSRRTSSRNGSTGRTAKSSTRSRSSNSTRARSNSRARSTASKRRGDTGVAKTARDGAANVLEKAKVPLVAGGAALAGVAGAALIATRSGRRRKVLGVPLPKNGRIATGVRNVSETADRAVKKS